MDLNQITISVTDIERSISFYEHLGLHLIVKSLAGYARFRCSVGNSTFSLHKVDEPFGSPGTWIYFEVHNLDEVVQNLIHKGFVFEEMPADKPWLWREAKLRDPDNNQLILYYAGENRINPPWKV